MTTMTAVRQRSLAYAYVDDPRWTTLTEVVIEHEARADCTCVQRADGDRTLDGGGSMVYRIVTTRGAASPLPHSHATVGNGNNNSNGNDSGSVTSVEWFSTEDRLEAEAVIERVIAMRRAISRLSESDAPLAATTAAAAGAISAEDAVAHDGEHATPTIDDEHACEQETR